MTFKPRNSHYPIRNTGLEVSPIGFGCAPLGLSLFGPLTDDQAIEVVQRAIQQGIRLFDTAPRYGNGLSETRLGLAFEGVPREKFVIETKLGLVQPDGHVRVDHTRDGILRSLEGSLERLKLDSVDILLIHDPDRVYKDALNNAFPVLDDLRAQGVVKAIGVGMNQWKMLWDFAREADFDVFMLAHRYTLLEHGAVDFLNMCAERKIAIHLAGVFNSGILATGASGSARFIYRDAPDEICSQVEQIEKVCSKYDVPLNAAAVQFAWAHPAVTSVVIGMNNPEEVYDNLGAINYPIPPALWEDLRHAGLLTGEAPVPGD